MEEHTVKSNEAKQFPIIKQFFTYDDYMELVENLVTRGETTGGNQSESLVELTRLNLRRMKRLNKNLELRPSLVERVKSLEKPQEWIVIVEAWCGDGAQNLPVLAKIAASSNRRIDLKIVLRDENEQLMDNYLTDGARAIPILIARDFQGTDLFKWGPRPATALKIAEDWKSKRDLIPKENFIRDLHIWYTKNGGAELQGEIAELLG